MLERYHEVFWVRKEISHSPTVPIPIGFIRGHDHTAAMETLKAIIALGYRIERLKGRPINNIRFQANEIRSLPGA